jgi:hypothetical protein
MAFLHRHRRLRKKITVRSDRRKVLKKLIGDGDISTGTISVNTHKQNARTPMVWKIIRESTDRFAELIYVTERRRSFHRIRLHVRQQSQQFVICHSYKFTS